MGMNNKADSAISHFIPMKLNKIPDEIRTTTLPKDMNKLFIDVIVALLLEGTFSWKYGPKTGIIIVPKFHFTK